MPVKNVLGTDTKPKGISNTQKQKEFEERKKKKKEVPENPKQNITFNAETGTYENQTNKPAKKEEPVKQKSETGITFNAETSTYERDKRTSRAKSVVDAEKQVISEKQRADYTQTSRAINENRDDISKLSNDELTKKKEEIQHSTARVQANSTASGGDIDYTTSRQVQKENENAIKEIDARIALNNDIAKFEEKGYKVEDLYTFDKDGNGTFRDLEAEKTSLKDENKEIQKQIDNLIDYESKNPNNPEIVALKNKIDENNAQLDKLGDLSKYQESVGARATLDYYKQEGDKQTVSELSDVYEHLDDSWLSRQIKGVGKTLVDIASTAMSLADMTQDGFYHAIADVSDYMATARMQAKDGNLTDEELEKFNEIFAKNDELRNRYDSMDPDLASVQLKEYSNRLAEEISFGANRDIQLDNGWTINGDVANFIGQGITSSANFLIQYALLGPTGSLISMSGQSATDTYFNLMSQLDEDGNPLYTQEQCFSNAIMHGLLSYGTEAIGMDSFVNILTGGSAELAMGHVLSYVTKSIIQQGMSEGAEELVEGFVGPLIDAIQLGTPIEYNGGELLMSFLLGAFSGVLMGAGGTIASGISFHIETSRQMNQIRQEVEIAKMLATDAQTRINELNKEIKYRRSARKLEALNAKLNAEVENLNALNRTIKTGTMAINNFREQSPISSAVQTETDANITTSTQEDAVNNLTNALLPDVRNDLKIKGEIGWLVNSIDTASTKLLEMQGVNMDAHQFVNELTDEKRIEVQKKARQFSDAFKNINIRFDTRISENSNINGRYNYLTNEITINPNSELNGNTIAITGIHEFLHSIEETQNYNKIESALVEALGGSDVLNKKIQEYANNYPELKRIIETSEYGSTEYSNAVLQLKKEVVAEEIASKFLNKNGEFSEKGANNFIEHLAKYNTSALYKMMYTFKDISNTIFGKNDLVSSLTKMMTDASVETGIGYTRDDIAYSLFTDPVEMIKAIQKNPEGEVFGTYGNVSVSLGQISNKEIVNIIGNKLRFVIDRPHVASISVYPNEKGYRKNDKNVNNGKNILSDENNESHHVDKITVQRLMDYLNDPICVFNYAYNNGDISDDLFCFVLKCTDINGNPVVAIVERAHSKQKNHKKTRTTVSRDGSVIDEYVNKVVSVYGKENISSLFYKYGRRGEIALDESGAPIKKIGFNPNDPSKGTGKFLYKDKNLINNDGDLPEILKWMQMRANGMKYQPPAYFKQKARGELGFSFVYENGNTDGGLKTFTQEKFKPLYNTVDNAYSVGKPSVSDVSNIEVDEDIKKILDNGNFSKETENTVNTLRRRFATIAPYRATQLTDANRNILIRKAQETFVNSANDIAKLLNIGEPDFIDNVGGYLNDEGTQLRELSYDFELNDSTPEQARMFACLMGEFGFENQDATIVKTYVEPNDPKGNALEYTLTFNDIEGMDEKLVSLGINNYTISGDSVRILDLYDYPTEGLDNAISLLVRQEGENYLSENSYKSEVQSDYIEREARRDIYKEWLETHPDSEQSGSESSSDNQTKELREIVSLAYEHVSDLLGEKIVENTVETEQPVQTETVENTTEEVNEPIVPRNPELHEYNVNKYGTIEQGFTPEDGFMREIDIAQATDKGKTQKFARTMAESKSITDEFARIIQESVDNGDMTIDAVTLAQLNEEAKENINRVGMNRSIESYLKSNALKDAQRTIAKGIELMRRLNASGDYETANKVAIKLASDLSISGQNLVASKMVKTLPEDIQIEFIQYQVAQIQKSVDNRFGEGKHEITVSNELYDKLRETNKIKNPTERADAKAEVLDEIATHIAKQVPHTLMDQLNAWRYLAMLGNPKTHIKNILSNAMFGEIVNAKRYVASGIEAVAKKAGWIDTRTNGIYSLMNEEHKRVYDYAKKLYKSNYNERGFDKYNLNKLVEVSNTDIFSTKNMFGRALNNAIKTNSSLLEKEDNFAKINTFARAYTGYVVANGYDINRMTEAQKNDAENWAYTECLRATFNDPNTLAKAINRFRNTNVGTKFAVDALLPFKNTPLNIISRGFEYSPLGLGKTLTIDAFRLYKTAKGGYDITGTDVMTAIGKNSRKLAEGAITANEFIDNLSAGLTGSAIAGLGALLASLGILKTKDDDKDRKRYFDKLNGEQEYALDLSPLGIDGTYTIDWLDPTIVPLSVGANFRNSLVDGGFTSSDAMSLLTASADALANSADPIFETSMLSSFANALTSYSDESGARKFGNAVGSAVSSYFLQYFPTIGGQLARTVDPIRRNTSALDGYLGEATIKKAINKVPFASYFLQPYINLEGEEQSNSYIGANNIIGRGIQQFLSAGYYAEKDLDEYDNELYRLYNETGSVAVFPSSTSKSTTYKNENYKFNSKELTQWNKTRYSEEKKLVDSFIDSDEYDDMTDEERAKAIGDIREYAGKIAKDEYLDGKGVKLVDSTYENINEALDTGMNLGQYFTTTNKYKDLKGEEDKKIEYLDFLDDSSMTAEQKNFMYDKYYGKSDFAKYSKSLGLSEEQTFAIRSVYSNAKGVKGSDGKTVSNSKAIEIANGYINNGVYEQILEYIDKNGLKPSAFGLTKSVIAMSTGAIAGKYKELFGGETPKVSSGTKKSGSSKSSKTSSKSTSSVSVKSGGASSRASAKLSNPLGGSFQDFYNQTLASRRKAVNAVKASDDNRNRYYSEDDLY